MTREFITDFQHDLADTERKVQQMSIQLVNTIVAYSQNPTAVNLENAQRVVDNFSELLIDMALRHNDMFPEDPVLLETEPIASEEEEDALDD